MAHAHLTLSLTETTQYRRLVDFLVEVDEYSYQHDLPGLAEIVRNLYAELLRDR